MRNAMKTKHLAVLFLCALLIVGLSPHRAAAGGMIFIQFSSVTVSGTTSETSVIGTGQGSPSVGANFFYQGSTYRFVVLGHMTTATLAPGTLRIRIKFQGVTMLDTGAQGMAGAVTNGQLFVNAYGTCRSY